MEKWKVEHYAKKLGLHVDSYSRNGKRIYNFFTAEGTYWQKLCSAEGVRQADIFLAGVDVGRKLEKGELRDATECPNS